MYILGVLLDIIQGVCFTMIDKIIRYLDLQSEKRQQKIMARSKSKSKGKDMDMDPVSLPVIPQYIALVSGVMIQPYLATFQQTRSWEFHDWPGWLLFALIIAATIFPAVYKKAFDLSFLICLALSNSFFTCSKIYRIFVYQL